MKYFMGEATCVLCNFMQGLIVSHEIIAFDGVDGLHYILMLSLAFQSLSEDFL
jgi:hypothetical protein